MGRSRTYASPVREEQARLTQQRIVDAARGLFTTGDGYAATTIAQIAAAAGVSGQTVYNVFGSKAALLKRVYDVTLAGDDAAVPMTDRPEMLRLHEMTDARAFLMAYADLGRVLMERLAPLLRMVVEGAAAGDVDLRQLVETTGGERLFGARHAAQRVVDLGGLRADVTIEEARDFVWTMISFEVWDLLTRVRGWSTAQAGQWIGAAMADRLVGPA